MVRKCFFKLWCNDVFNATGDYDYLTDRESLGAAVGHYHISDTKVSNDTNGRTLDTNESGRV